MYIILNIHATHHTYTYTGNQIPPKQYVASGGLQFEGHAVMFFCQQTLVGLSDCPTGDVHHNNRKFYCCGIYPLPVPTRIGLYAAGQTNW